MTDLVQRLRAAGDAEAADEIERLGRIADELQAMCDRQALKLGPAEAEIERLRAALGFYADPLRYHGPNQRILPGDKFISPQIEPYRLDVTRDNGDIARAALTPSPTDTQSIDL